MPHVTDHDLGLPPGRYGQQRKTPRWVVALLGVVGVLVLLPILLSAVDKATPDIRGTLTGFVPAENTIAVTVDIAKPDGTAATCTVQARDFYSDVVGSTQITLAATAAPGAVTKTFPTSGKAVVAEVTTCTAASGD